MASIPKNKITPVSGNGASPEDGMSSMREKRTTQWGRGFKNGMIKGSIESVLEQVAGPIADIICPKLHELYPKLAVADPAVRAGIEFALLQLFAVILEYGGPHVAKLPGLKMSPEDAEKKCYALAQWIRNFSGEKVGEQLAETAAKLIPMVANVVAEADIGELFSHLGNPEEIQEFQKAEILGD